VEDERGPESASGSRGFSGIQEISGPERTPEESPGCLRVPGLFLAIRGLGGVWGPTASRRTGRSQSGRGWLVGVSFGPLSPSQAEVVTTSAQSSDSLTLARKVFESGGFRVIRLACLLRRCGNPHRRGVLVIAIALLACSATGCTQIAAPINAAKCNICQGSGKCIGCGGDGFFIFGLPCEGCKKTGKCSNCSGWGFGGDK